MQSFQFPQPLVSYLNAAEAGNVDEAERTALIVYLQELYLWLRQESQLLIGLEEEAAYNELRSLGAELTEVLSASYVRLEQVSHEFSLALERFRRLRSRLRFVDLVEFDELMQAAVAASNGKDCLAEVERRLVAAVTLLAGLAEQIGACSPWLPAEVNEALDHGVQLVDDGLVALHNWLNTGRGLRPALLMLKTGGNLLGYFVHWRLQESGWHNPLADNRLWAVLYRLQQDRARGLEAPFPLDEVQAVAAEYRAQRLLSAHQQVALWAEWDELMEPGSEKRLEDLLALVEDMENARLDTGRAFATFLEGLVLAGTGVWTGHLPHSYLRRELQALFPRAVGEDSLLYGLDWLRTYLDQGQRLSLCRGLEVVLDYAQTCALPEAVLTGLQCRCCQQFFDPADPNDRCISLAAHQYLAVCA